MKTSRYVLTALLLIAIVSMLALAVAPTAAARQTNTATPTATITATIVATSTTTATTTATAEATATAEPTVTAAATPTAAPEATATSAVTTTATAEPTEMAPVQASVLDLQAALENVYVQASPSVVSIRTRALAAQQFGRFSPDPESDTPQYAEGLGSGFVWDDQGHIVTNNHVVAGAERLTVIFSDGLSLTAEVVGRDPESDLAVIKVDATDIDLKPVTVADSTAVRVGQFAVAIGNPFGLDTTMTFGIISALGRTLPVGDGTMMSATRYTIPDIIQTDAPVNPGNSGGVLLDLQGRLIGVPTAIESSTRSSAGVGFAVPSVIVQKVVPELISKGSFEHPYLGVAGTTLTSQLAAAMDLPARQRGALVVEVANDGPADKAGLLGSAKQAEIDGQPVPVGGDVIIAVDGQPVRDFEDVTTYLARNGRVGQDITLTVLRDGEETDVTVTLAARPSAQRGTTDQPRQQTMARAWLGINGATLTVDLAEAMDLDADQEGVLILNVINGSPADEAGLRGGFRALNLNGERLPIGGDVIVAVDGEDMPTMEALIELVAGKNPGDTVTLTILRDGEQSDVTVTLGERPASQ